MNKEKMNTQTDIDSEYLQIYLYLNDNLPFYS